MNNFFKFGLVACVKKANGSAQILPKCVTKCSMMQPASRSLWHMGPVSTINNFVKPLSLTKISQRNNTSLSHSDAEKDLVDFLGDEIAQEKKSLKMKSLPADLDGFSITADEAELIFRKQSKNETVLVSMNVNHSVDSEVLGEEGEYAEEMKAKPSFDVEIQRNGKTLCFSCSYTQLDEEADRDAADNFEISEVTFYEGDWKEKTYSVAADLLDENLYDLLMVILEEKGITKKFVEKVSEIATSHEHSQYINLLENVKKFASG